MKKTELFVKNEEGMYPCRHCLLKDKEKKQYYPKIHIVDGMYYARCPHCKFYDKFDFLALSRKKVIEVWNRAMLGRDLINDKME